MEQALMIEQAWDCPSVFRIFSLIYIGKTYLPKKENSQKEKSLTQ